jgi:glutamine amidotransferase
MARLVGFIGNRPDLCNRFAAYESGVLRVRNKNGTPWSWGLGFYQSGEVLLKRRPLDERDDLTVDQMIADVRADILVVHVRKATVGALRTDNTHPFRYRQWLFADTGTVDGFADVRAKLLDSLPEFLQRSLRGDTDSELIFHLFLSFLHDAGKLDHPVVAAKEVFPALKSALGLLDRIGRDSGLSTSRLNILVSTPDYVVAVHRGQPMGYRVLKGRDDFEPMFDVEGPGKLRMPDLEPCRLGVVASDFDDERVPEGWTPVPEGAMVAFTRTDDPVLVQPSR